MNKYPVIMFSLEWRLFRAGILTLVTILHFPLGILSIIALVKGSGGAVQIATIAFDSVILATIAICVLVKAAYPDGTRNRKVDLWIFGSLTTFSFGLSILLLSRIKQSATGSLIDDYTSIGGSTTYVGSIVSCLATFGFLFSCVGLAATLVDDYTVKRKLEGPLLRPPFGLSLSLPSLRPISPELVWDGQARRAYFPDGTPAKLMTAPTHVDKWDQIHCA